MLKDNVPCEHPGCLNHITHPCEGCGRIAGIYPQDLIDDKWPESCQHFTDPNNLPDDMRCKAGSENYYCSVITSPWFPCPYGQMPLELIIKPEELKILFDQTWKAYVECDESELHPSGLRLREELIDIARRINDGSITLDSEIEVTPGMLRWVVEYMMGYLDGGPMPFRMLEEILGSAHRLKMFLSQPTINGRVIMSPTFTNGARVTDKVSGFTGTVVATVTYIHGSPRYEVCGDGFDVSGKPNEEWFEQDRLKLAEPVEPDEAPAADVESAAGAEEGEELEE